MGECPRRCRTPREEVAVSEMSASPTRITLIRRVQGSLSQPSWAELHAIYIPVILGWCSREGLQASDAQDVAQEVFRKLLEGIKTYCPLRGRFRCWLWRVVNRAVVDLRRAAGRWPHLIANG